MVRQSEATGATRTRIVLAAIVLGVVLYLLANTSRDFTQERQLDTIGLNAALVAVGTEREQALANLPDLRRQLLIAPIDQRMLNQFLTARDENGDWSDEEIAALGQLGYRSSIAQLNLLTLAAKRGDWAEAIRRTDALLRRRQAINEVRALMFLAESTAPGRQQLVQSLSDWPEWAEPYFVDSRFTRLEGGIAARMALFDLASENGAKLPRRIAARSSTHMAQAGNFEAAHQLFMQYREDSSGLGLTDPEFIKSAAISSQGEQPFPFDWNAIESEGARFRVRSVSDGVSATLRWDGRGNPKFFEKTVRLDGRIPELRMVMPVGDIQTAVRILQLEWTCLTPDGNGPSVTERGRPDAANSALVFPAPILPDCEFAKLTLKGLSSGIDTSYTIKVNQVWAI